MKSMIGKTAGGMALVLALGGLAACGAETGGSAQTAATAETAAPAMPAAADSPMVGGAAMLPTRTIVENASAAPNLSTLVAAVKAADLVATLSGAGPFTVFAPTDDAFAKLPAGTVDSLVQPAQKQQLSGILTYHVVAGKVAAADLVRQIEAGGGTATLTTVNGATLTARAANGGVQLTDAAGGTAMVTQADVAQSNGMVHVIDTVLMPG